MPSNWAALKEKALKRGCSDLAAFCDALDKADSARDREDWEESARHNDTAEKALVAWKNRLHQEKVSNQTDKRSTH